MIAWWWERNRIAALIPEVSFWVCSASGELRWQVLFNGAKDEKRRCAIFAIFKECK